MAHLTIDLPLKIFQLKGGTFLHLFIKEDEKSAIKVTLVDLKELNNMKNGRNGLLRSRPHKHENLLNIFLKPMCF